MAGDRGGLPRRWVVQVDYQELRMPAAVVASVHETPAAAVDAAFRLAEYASKRGGGGLVARVLRERDVDPRGPRVVRKFEKPRLIVVTPGPKATLYDDKGNPVGRVRRGDERLERALEKDLRRTIEQEGSS